MPDLDVLLGNFVSQTTQLGIHRGFSHSLLFAALGGLAGGKLLAKLYSDLDIPWRQWATLCLLALFTHSLLDVFTMYGTQLFNPFSDYPVALSTIFIIDPLYTVPLLVLLLLALRHPPNAHRRRMLNSLGLGLSTIYLLLTFANSLHVRATFATALDRQEIAHQRLFATPTPLNNALWMGIAEQGDSLYIGHYSLFDGKPPEHFRRIGKNTDLIANQLDQRPLRKLLWFSRGYYQVTQEADEIYFNDLRFGRSDIWLEERGDYIFSFRLLPNPQDTEQIVDFAQRPPAFALGSELLHRFWRRVRGHHHAGEFSPHSH